MKNQINIFLITIVLILLPMISCTNHDEDSELLIKTTSESLKSVLDEYFPKYNYDLENTKIIFEKNSIEILPYIEQMVKKDYQWVWGSV